MMAFAFDRSAQGPHGRARARDLIKAGVIKGFKFHLTVQGFFPNDRMAYELYEVIAEHKRGHLPQRSFRHRHQTCRVAAAYG